MKKLRRSELGLGLIDVLVALAIMATAATAFVAAIGTGVRATHNVKEDTIAQSLARSQLEYVKDLPYDPDATSYPSIDTSDGYSITADISSIPGADLNIQMVTVTVSRSGKTLFVAEEYKQNR